MRIAFVLAWVCVSSVLAESVRVDPIDKLESPLAGRVVGPPNDHGILVVDTSQTTAIAETRVRAKMVVDESGEQRQRSVHYISHRLVSDNRLTVVDLSDVRFIRPDGTPLDSEQIKDGLVTGAPVLVCPAHRLEPKWRDVLSEKTIVILRNESPDRGKFPVVPPHENLDTGWAPTFQ